MTSTARLTTLAVLVACVAITAPSGAQDGTKPAPKTPDAPKTDPAPKTDAGAKGGHDLRAEYAPHAGDHVALVERVRERGKVTVRQGEQVVEQKDQDDGYEQRYREDVQEVDHEGRVTKAQRAYSHVENFGSPEGTFDAGDKPVKVQLTRAESGATFAPIDSMVVPPALQSILDAEDGQEASLREQRTNRRKLLPEAPQAVGGTWPVAIADAAEVLFDMEETTLDASKSTATGTLEAIEKLGDVDATRVVVRMKLALTKFQGMTCAEPVIFDATLTMIAPVGASGPGTHVALTGTIKGKATLPEGAGPPNSQVEFDVSVDITRNVDKVAQ